MMEFRFVTRGIKMFMKLYKFKLQITHYYNFCLVLIYLYECQYIFKMIKMHYFKYRGLAGQKLPVGPMVWEPLFYSICSSSVDVLQFLHHLGHLWCCRGLPCIDLSRIIFTFQSTTLRCFHCGVSLCALTAAVNVFGWRLKSAFFGDL